MNNPLFSVLVFTYNHEKYIAKALDSILSQEHDYSYEIVVGEDCSTDNTRKILQEYKEKHPDIITLLLNESNMGLIKNYFNVIRHSQGKYIMLCAGDDWWLPRKVAVQIPFMEEHPDIGMCYGKAPYFIEKKNRMGKSVDALPYIRNGILERFSVSPHSMCIRKELMLEYIEEIKPESHDWLMEDWPFASWLVYSKKKLFFMNEEVVVYRVLEESACHFKDFEKARRFALSVKDVDLFFLKKYNKPFSDDLLHLRFMRQLAGYAVQCRNYSAFKETINRFNEPSFKYFMKRKIIASSKLAFWVYGVFLGIKRNWKLFYKANYTPPPARQLWRQICKRHLYLKRKYRSVQYSVYMAAGAA